jgi:cystathionine beta-lyase family protein involved in aluminum resistance
LQNTRRVLEAFSKHQVDARHFAPTTGYGYGDIGRDTLEAVFADLFGTEAAIVRPHIASGTMRFRCAVWAFAAGRTILLSASGKPIDTLEEIIGLSGNAPGSLKEMNVSYSHAELDGRECWT